jgi:hypothetical protein
MLRARIWPLLRDQNGSNGTLWVPSEARYRVPPGLFGPCWKGRSAKFADAKKCVAGILCLPSASWYAQSEGVGRCFSRTKMP